MDQGPHEKFIIEQSVRMRMPLPDKIKNAPVLYQGLELYYSAFLELNDCRPIGFSEGAIPWTARDQYAKSNDFSREQEQDLHYFVKQLDAAYLERAKKKSAQPRTPKGGK